MHLLLELTGKQRLSGQENNLGALLSWETQTSSECWQEAHKFGGKWGAKHIVGCLVTRTWVLSSVGDVLINAVWSRWYMGCVSLTPSRDRRWGIPKTLWWLRVLCLVLMSPLLFARCVCVFLKVAQSTRASVPLLQSVPPWRINELSRLPYTWWV